MKNSTIILLCALVIGLYGCTTAPVDSGQEPVEVVSAGPMAWDGISAAPYWNGFLSVAINARDLGNVAVLNDAGEFCPKYSELSVAQRFQFWNSLVSWMTKYESNFDPTQTYTEDFDDASGKKVISRGLLQISIESANGKAYACKINTAEALHDPKTNLTCGVTILDHWVRVDGYVGKTVNGEHKGGARYWSVLRNASKSRPKIIAGLHALKFCW